MVKASPAAGGNTEILNPYTIDVTGEVGDLKQGVFLSTLRLKAKLRLLVPLSSLVMDDSKNYVWIVDEQNKRLKKLRFHWEMLTQKIKKSPMV